MFRIRLACLFSDVLSNCQIGVPINNAKSICFRSTTDSESRLRSLLSLTSVLSLLIHSDYIMRNLKISLARNKTFVRNSYPVFWSSQFTSLRFIVTRHTIHSTSL